MEIKKIAGIILLLLFVVSIAVPAALAKPELSEMQKVVSAADEAVKSAGDEYTNKLFPLLNTGTAKQLETAVEDLEDMEGDVSLALNNYELVRWQYLNSMTSGESLTLEESSFLKEITDTKVPVAAALLGKVKKSVVAFDAEVKIAEMIPEFQNLTEKWFGKNKDGVSFRLFNSIKDDAPVSVVESNQEDLLDLIKELADIRDDAQSMLVKISGNDLVKADTKTGFEQLVSAINHEDLLDSYWDENINMVRLADAYIAAEKDLVDSMNQLNSQLSQVGQEFSQAVCLGNDFSVFEIALEGISAKASLLSKEAYNHSYMAYKFDLDALEDKLDKFSDEFDEISEDADDVNEDEVACAVVDVDPTDDDSTDDDSADDEDRDEDDSTDDDSTDDDSTDEDDSTDDEDRDEDRDEDDSTDDDSTDDDSTDDSTTEEDLWTKYSKAKKDYRDLETKYDSDKKKYDRAVSEQDKSDIKKYKNRLNDIEDDVEKLQDVVEDLIDEVELDKEVTDKTLLLNKLDDLEEDVDDLENSVDNTLSSKKSGTSTSKSSTTTYTPPKSTSTTKSPTNTGSSVKVEKINLLPPVTNPVAPQSVTTQEDSFVELALLAGGVFVVAMLVMFLLAVLLFKR